MVLSTLTQSFAFHSSPESFISSRLQDLALSDPELLPSAAGSSKIVVASILNRNVHIVSSYQLCKDILEASSSPSSSSLTPSTITPAATTQSNGTASQQALDAETIVAGPAYHQLMSDFFPSPNLLLQDGPTHGEHKQAWKDHLSAFPSEVIPLVRQIAERHVSSLLRPTAAEPDGKLDLYESLKSLAWEILLSIFLNLTPSSSPSPTKFSDLETLQETLLRGQFSLFPVSINARIWQSARSKGIKARKDLQTKLAELVKGQEASCPFLKQGKVSRDDAASHALLFTSSIAVKALTSLCMAFVLNLFLWRDREHQPTNHSNEERGEGEEEWRASSSLASLIRSQGSPTTRKRMLCSILLETERLSPPVVGVMRRTRRDVFLGPKGNGAGAGKSHAVPAGHDIWLYLSGAARDPTVFGADADVFRFDRYMASQPDHQIPDVAVADAETVPAGLAYGTGAKTCLGIDLVREIVMCVGEVMVQEEGFGLDGEGVAVDKGVRGWLGWESGVGAEWVAKGMKQLPVQRPRGVVEVRIKRRG